MSRGCLVLAVVVWALGCGMAEGGGSGLNLLVVANQNSSDSLELANYYLRQRGVPSEQLLRISWPGGNIEWTEAQFETHLLTPLVGWLSDTGRSNQIQYLMLSMDIPYRISDSPGNSTTAALFYGVKHNSDPLNSSYAFSEASFELQPPASAPTHSFLAMMLTANSIEEARRTIDQGIASDGMLPTQTVWLAKSDDVSRNQRHRKFDHAIFNTRFLDGYVLARTNQAVPGEWTNLLGCQIGLANLSVAPNAFVPGAVADSMTSFGGRLFEKPGQITLLAFTEAGAAGSYGTVSEPTASVAKFPDPQVYFYQARGFSLAECYYQSVKQPAQGLFVGEPLAAPWRQYLKTGWVGISSNAVLVGRTNLCVSAYSGGAEPLVERLGLYVDGKFHRTLTNLPPQPGNRLVLRLNGYPVSFDVPTNATRNSIAAGLAVELNKPLHTNVTKVGARAYGDRIQLQSFAAPLPDGVFEMVDNQATFAEPRVYLAAPSSVPRAVSVLAGGWTDGGAFRVGFDSTPGVSNVLEASTNLQDWTVVWTNAAGGATEYVDADAALHPRRFYRAVMPPANTGIELRVLGINDSGECRVQVAAPTNRPYVLQASADFMLWSDVATNNLGGDAEFIDGAASGWAGRFYRTRSADPNDYAPIAVVGQTSTGGTILQVQATTPGDIVVWSSTNATDWRPIFLYPGEGRVQTETASLSTSGEPLTSHLVKARSNFLLSTARGVREFGVESDPMGPASLSSTSYLALEVTKTNGRQSSVTVTNPTGNLSVSNFVSALVAAINTHPELAQEDGVEADDLQDGFSGQMLFSLCARAEGQRAAEVQARLSGSADLLVSPGSPVRLDQNQTDLLPRNHLYVRAGVPSLVHCFDLDTRLLADGCHELTVVAYEGSNVQSQSPRTIPVVVSNTPVQATLSLAEPAAVLNVTNTFDLVVTANTAQIDTIQLFTTAGFHSGRTNQPAASFHVSGADLGVGEHAFYAMVTTTNGWRYRTASVPVILVRP